MAEEISDAGKTVPQAMWRAYLMNGIIGLVFVISYMFAITDVSAALDDATGYPHMWVFSQAFSGNGNSAAGLNVVPTILIFAGTLTFNLSTSRQTWAFARDQGLPFSGWIAKVDKKRQVPANAVAVTCLFTILLSLINIGSDVAFNASKYLSPPSVVCVADKSCSHLPQRRLSHDHLRLQYQLRPLQTNEAPRASAAVQVVSRQMGRPGQRSRSSLLSARLLLVLLARSYTCRG